MYGVLQIPGDMVKGRERVRFLNGFRNWMETKKNSPFGDVASAAIE